MIPKLPVWFSAIAGAIVALAGAPFGIIAAAFAGGVLHLSQSVHDRSLSAASSRGWLFGFGYFSVTLHWIVEPFLVDSARHGWMAPFALVFLCGGLAVFWALAQGLAFFVSSETVPADSSTFHIKLIWKHERTLASAPRSNGYFLMNWAFALGGVEVLRSFAFTGFPWGLLGYIWVDTQISTLAAVVGPHGLGLLSLLAICVFAWAVLNRHVLPARVGWGTMIGVLIVVLAGMQSTPLARANVEPAGGEQTLVRIVQPNAPQSEKWLPEKARVFFDRSVALSEAAPEDGERRPDLIVWPETSIPVWLDEADVAIGMISRVLRQTPVIAGLQRADRLRFFNTAVVIDDGYVTDFYDKAQLVPFGEYLPFGGLLSKLGIYGLAANEGGGFSRGIGMRTLHVGELGRAQILICYEGIFPHLAGATKERPAFFALITNDGWFGNWAGPRQHLVQAQFRSLEQGIPMLRSANTGISAIIDAHGRVTAQLGMNQTGFIDAVMPAVREATIYARTRDWPIIGVFMLWLIGTSVLVWRRSPLT